MDDCWVGQEEGLGHCVFLFHFQILECLLANNDSNTFINLLVSLSAVKCLSSPTLVGRFFLEKFLSLSASPGHLDAPSELPLSSFPLNVPPFFSIAFSRKTSLNDPQ